MTEYDFALYLNGIVELDDRAVDALYEAGCDDALPRQATVFFARKSESLKAAIRSAIGDVQRAGFTVSRAVIETDAMTLL